MDVAAGRVGLARTIAAEMGAVHGDEVTLQLAGRTVTARVVAIYPAAPALADVVIDPADLRRLAPRASATELRVDTVDHSTQSIDLVHEAVVAAAGQGSAVVVATPAADRAELADSVRIVE